MERAPTGEPFDEALDKRDTKRSIDAEYLNEHVRKFIEELTRGSTPQEAARHSESFRNTKFNYRLEKARHQNPWK